MLTTGVLIGTIATLSWQTTRAQSDDGFPVTPVLASNTKMQKLEKRNRRLLRKLGLRERQLVAAQRGLRRKWEPVVSNAIRLAAIVSGIDEWKMRSVARCESNFYPYARNGQYLGIFQMHWRPFGMSPFDPYASALSAAFTVRRDGSWRQWECG